MAAVAPGPADGAEEVGRLLAAEDAQQTAGSAPPPQRALGRRALALAVAPLVVVVFWLAASSLSPSASELASKQVLERKMGLDSWQPPPVPPQKLSIHGKSWYFVLIDSFAKTTGSFEACDTSVPGWCGGTLQGIISKLDYIQSMGFECLWVSPVLKQFEGPDPDGCSGYGQYGYWAYDWYAIDESYGTKDDFHVLSDELHKRGMCLVYDMVVNHVGPVHSTDDVHKIHPFNETWYYSQPAIGNKTFDQYSRGMTNVRAPYEEEIPLYPPPYQAVGPGSMCAWNAQPGCNNYRCPVDPGGFGEPCPTTPDYLNASAAGPTSLPYCGVGDYVCAGYDQQAVEDGWFFTLAGLNQSVPFVRDELLRWGKYMVDTYNVDGIRLDTAPYVPKDFLTKFQQHVGVPILGEVTSQNFSFFSEYSPKRGPPVLDGLLNFPVTAMVPPAFCGSFYPGAVFNLTRLGEAMRTSLTSGMLSDVDLLGNFADNHDQGRIANLCDGDESRLSNALVWTMMYKGIPIIYYGTEVGLTQTRQSMWNVGYSEMSDGSNFMKKLNSIRKSQDIGLKSAEVKHAGANRLIFTRGGDHDTWIFLNNLGDSRKEVKYCHEIPEAPHKLKWVDLLSGEDAVFQHGCVMGPSSQPMILGLRYRRDVPE